MQMLIAMIAIHKGMCLIGQKYTDSSRLFHVLTHAVVE